MKRLLALFLISTSAFAGDIHLSHCVKACPTGANSNNDLVITPIYALSNNKTTKFADWVAYRITRLTMGTARALNKGWKADPRLDDNEILEPNDYKNTSSDLRMIPGHQAPMAAFAGTRYWRETNTLSNVTPQSKDLDSGPWKRLERRVENSTWEHYGLYVLTGPLYEKPMPPLPGANESHKVPSGYWKVIVDEGSAIGFIMNQDIVKDADECASVQSIKSIEQKTGLTLFPDFNVKDGKKEIVDC